MMDKPSLSAQAIAKILLDIGAVKVEMNPPFTWTSGIKSPVYCDNRKLISYPDARKRVVAGATYPEQAKVLRKLMPRAMPRLK